MTPLPFDCFILAKSLTPCNTCNPYFHSGKWVIICIHLLFGTQSNNSCFASLKILNLLRVLLNKAKVLAYICSLLETRGMMQLVDFSTFFRLYIFRNSNASNDNWVLEHYIILTSSSGFFSAMNSCNHIWSTGVIQEEFMSGSLAEWHILSSFSYDLMWYIHRP